MRCYQYNDCSKEWENGYRKQMGEINKRDLIDLQGGIILNDSLHILKSLSEHILLTAVPLIPVQVGSLLEHHPSSITHTPDIVPSR